MNQTTKDRFATGSMDWVRDQVARSLAEVQIYGWARDIFPDRVIFESADSNELVEIPYTVSGDVVSLGQPTAVGVEYVAKGLPAIELTGPIVDKTEDRRIVYAPVLVPDEPDSDGDVVKADQIERVAHLWLEKYRNIDHMHTMNNIGQPVESFIAPVDIEFPGGTVPKGSWVLAARVPAEVWPDVKKGKLTGFSLMAVRGDDLALSVKGDGDFDLAAAMKRTTLADLGEDWVVPFVSVVDEPAVPKAKFVALKRAAAAAAEHTPNGLVDRLRGLLTGEAPEPRSDKAGRRFSKATYSQMRAAFDALAALLEEADAERESKSGKSAESEDDMNEEQTRALVAEEVEKATAPIAEAVGNLAEAIKAIAEPVSAELEVTQDDAAPAEATQEAVDAAEIEALKTELAELREFRADVEKRLTAKSKALKAGEDADTADEDDAIYTDSHGQRYRRDAAGRARPVL